MSRKIFILFIAKSDIHNIDIWKLVEIDNSENYQQYHTHAHTHDRVLGIIYVCICTNCHCNVYKVLY